MGSATQSNQVDLDKAMARRNEVFGVSHQRKAEARKDIVCPGIHERKFSTGNHAEPV